jgi:PST family polysaccharide transporter
VLQLGLRVLLVRMLSPDDFGLLAMVTVVSSFLLMFNDLGFGPALVRKQQVTESQLSTIFWVTVGSGLILSLATAALGLPLARFYHQPALVALCAGLAPGSLLLPLSTVPNAVLQRRMSFHSLAVVDVLGVAAGGVTAVILAARGLGVWSLVWQSNVSALTILLVTWGAASWMPRRRFDRAVPASLWRFSGHFTAALVLNYWVRNLDNLLIGVFLGRAALGFYSQAYQMMLYPVQNVAALAGRVMVPTLSSLQGDGARFRRAYLQAVRGIAAITFPLMMGAMILAPDLYRVLFGPQWERSIPIFRILCLVGMIQSIVTTTGWIYLTTGRTDMQLGWTVCAAVVIVPAFLFGLHWGGLKGLTVGYALGSVLLSGPGLLIAFNLIQLRLQDVIRPLLPLLAAAVGMAVCVVVLIGALGSNAEPLVRLLLGITLGTIAYPVMLQLLGQAPAREIRTLWRALHCG